MQRYGRSVFRQQRARLRRWPTACVPRTLDEFIGQTHIVGRGQAAAPRHRGGPADQLHFLGPARLRQDDAGVHHCRDVRSAAFVKLNAVTSGVADVREVLRGGAGAALSSTARPTYLLLDECHRWSKAQSDSILPAIEQGLIRFIGSTTENPMIAMTPAIVSRCRLFHFEPLTRGGRAVARCSTRVGGSGARLRRSGRSD